MSNNHSYDVIFSLGADCACASYMKRHAIRSCSGPFDWLTKAPLETRVELVCNDFSGFMNISDFHYLDNSSLFVSDNGCDCYENSRTGLHFYHDFKANVPFEQAFDEVQAKYLRRIRRFYSAVNESRRVLFLWFAHNHNNFENIERYHSEIECKFSKKIDVVCIENDSCFDLDKCDRFDFNDRLVYYKLNTMVYDDDGMPTTLGRVEACDPLFAAYQLRHQKFNYLRQMLLRSAVKGACVLVPFRHYRKQIRQKLNAKLKYL